MMQQQPDSRAIRDWADRVANNLEKVFYGKRPVIEKLLVALLGRGHALMEDVPGTGKTVLARAMAASLGASFNRIQCTPDLLPADVLGVSIYSPKDQSFFLRQGPIVSSVVLVDEINRATPRTQSALLEAMGERQISVDGQCIKLPEPFFLIATENPVEFEGTFPLPEAQKDRFMLSLGVGYPERDSEIRMLESQRRLDHPVVDIAAVTNTEEILKFQAEVVKVHVDESVLNYMLELVDATRKDSSLRIGVSPRGSIALYKSCQAFAAIQGRGFVVPEDVKALVPDVFRKRLIMKPDALIKNVTPERVIMSILDSVPVPAFKERV